MDAVLLSVIAVMGALLAAVLGSFVGGVWVRAVKLDKVQAVLDVKLEVIDTQKETIETLRRDNLLLQAVGANYNGLISVLKGIATGGGT